MGHKELSAKLVGEKFFLDDGTIDKLEHFALLLHEWNRIHNLTGAKDIQTIYDNIIDSVYPTGFIDEPNSLLDVGTGAGFPGLVLGIVWDDAECVLCEPINKRASFLKFVAEELSLKNIKVAKSRVEQLRHNPFDLISSRAVTDTELLLSITKHLSSKETQYLFYKGGQIYDEISSLSNQLNYDIVSREKRNYLWIKKCF